MSRNTEPREYVVEVPVRGVLVLTVEAHTAKEAVEIVANGGGVPLDHAQVDRVGKGRAWLDAAPPRKETP